MDSTTFFKFIKRAVQANMAKTQVRATQFRVKDITELQMAVGSVSGASANKGGAQGTLATGTVSTPDLRNGSVTPSKRASAPISIASSSGVITLTDNTDFFLVDGTENVTKIQGWESGKVMIQWQSARTITHDGGIIEIPGGANKQVDSGDISTFVFFADGYVREIGYIEKLPSADLGPVIHEVVATHGQTIFPLPVTPPGKNYVTVTINGITIFGIHYDVTGSDLFFNSGLEAGDEVRVSVITKLAAAAVGGTDVYDGGNV